MKESLQQAAEQVVSGTAGQIIDKAGYTSIGTGLGIGVADKTTSIISMIPSTLTEWAAFVSILGGLSFILKNLFEIWWRIRQEKKNNARTDT